MSGDGELALVLHTHMPYVEGFGTWPFGEEWLWEAIASSLPAAARRARARRADHAVADAGAVRSARCAGRHGALPGVPPGDPTRVTPARRRRVPGRRGGGAWRRSSSARRWSTRTPPIGSRRCRRDLASVLGRHATWTSAATHPILPLLATDTGVQLQVQTGRGVAPATLRRLVRRILVARMRPRSWLDSLLEDAGRPRHLRRADRPTFGLGDARHLRPLAVRRRPGAVADRPGDDRPRVERRRLSGRRRLPRLPRRSHDAPPPGPWRIDGAPYDHARRARAGARRRGRLRRAGARPGRRWGRVRVRARHRAARPLVV